MAKAKDDAGFERDFGYLLPFLDRVGQAAAGLADPAARARLTALVAEEKARWPEIRALLAGGPVTPPPTPAAARREEAVGAGPVARAPSDPTRLTVGSLRPKR